MNALSVKNLTKKYESFLLDNVSFEVEQGEIMGFIGRNGAGKTTTLKSMLNFVHPDAGEILFFGKSFRENELEIKQRIGFVSGGTDYYTKSRLSVITGVTRRFYDRWDDSAYRNYTEMFELDERKTPQELSAGMRVKYALALALSHRAELLILDEPTSGLDPVSRDDLLDVFLSLEDEGVTILFSTHITSDIEKCADTITYIKKGGIVASEKLGSFTGRYVLLELSQEQLDAGLTGLIGVKRSKNGYTALADASQAQRLSRDGIVCAPADLESVMVHLEKE